MDRVLEARVGSGCEFPWPWPAMLSGVVAGDLGRDAEAMGGGGMGQARAGASLGARRRPGRQLRGLPVVGGPGMAGTQQCVPLPRVYNKTGVGLGWARMVGGLSWAAFQVSLSFFLFLFYFLLTFVLAS